MRLNDQKVFLNTNLLTIVLRVHNFLSSYTKIRLSSKISKYPEYVAFLVLYILNHHEN